MLEEFPAQISAHLANGDRQNETVKPLPDPIHGVWDLDTLTQEKNHFRDTLPLWVMCLTQNQANRLLQVIDALPRDNGQKTSLERARILQHFFRQTLQDAQYGLQLDEIVQTILINTASTTTHIRTWISRHLFDDLPQTIGTHIKKPGMLRIEEQKLVKANLKKIIAKHFQGHTLPPAHRTLMDIGSWNGEIPMSLRSFFGSVVAVEPNEERFAQLRMKETHTFRCVQTTLEDIMSNPAEHDYRPDVIYMGFLLQFLSLSDEDEEALLWAHRTVRKGGMAIVTLNDAERTFPSRAHLRHTLGVRESAAHPERYRAFLEDNGITAQILRPNLSIQAKTAKGMEAMRDVFTFLLPGITRHHHGAIDDYLKRVQEGGGVFNHTISIMVLFRNAQDVPVQKMLRPARYTEKRESPGQKLSTGSAAPQTPAPLEQRLSAERINTMLWTIEQRLKKNEEERAAMETHPELPEVPSLRSLTWVQWTPAMICRFLAEVEQEKAVNRTGATKRVSDRYNVPAGKYNSWKEDYPDGVVPAATRPIETTIPDQPIQSGEQSAPLPAPQDVSEPATAASDILHNPSSQDSVAPVQVMHELIEENQHTEPPLSNLHYVPSGEPLQSLQRKVRHLTGKDVQQHADLVRELCTAYAKMAREVAQTVFRDDKTGWSHNLLKSKAIGALIDIAHAYTGTKEEFPDHARPRIREALLHLMDDVRK